MEVRKHNTLVDYVDSPRITSTVKALVSFPNSYSNSTTGLVSKFTGGGCFEALCSLGHLGSGFLDHLLFPIFKGGFNYNIFTRAADHDAIFRWKGAEQRAIEPQEGKIVIESLTLRVPLVEYSGVAKI